MGGGGGCTRKHFLNKFHPFGLFLNVLILVLPLPRNFIVDKRIFNLSFGWLN